MDEQKLCYNCREPKQDNNSFLCDTCRSAGVKLTMCGVAGLSDGPGSCAYEGVFDRPDPLKECQMTAKKMEEAGQLKNPKIRAAVNLKLKKLKEQAPLRQKVDYQKNSGAEHPLSGAR